MVEKARKLNKGILRYYNGPTISADMTQTYLHPILAKFINRITIDVDSKRLEVPTTNYLKMNVNIFKNTFIGKIDSGTIVRVANVGSKIYTEAVNINTGTIKQEPF